MSVEVVTGPEITIVPCLGETTKLDTPEFTKSLLAEFNKKKVWRSISNLSTTLHVDAKQLSELLDKDPAFVRRAGKEDGTFYYALVERLPKETSEKSEGPPLNRVKREEDGYALGMLHMTYFQLYKILKTYGLEISQRDAEAFANFTTSFDKLEAGLLLFSKKTKASMDKLPKFS